MGRDAYYQLAFGHWHLECDANRACRRAPYVLADMRCCYGIIPRAPLTGHFETRRTAVKSATCLLMCLLAAIACFGQEDLSKLLSFENEHSGGRLTGWGGGPPETIFADEQVVYSGKWSARLERTAGSSQQFSTITRAMPMDFEIAAKSPAL
jgi:hypothetical protein